MDEIKHITLNSGHVRITRPEEVGKDLYFYLKRIYKGSLSKDGAELFEGYRVKTTQAGGYTITTVFAADGAPILTTGCCAKDDGTLWRLLHETATDDLATSPDEVPAGPYIADRLEIGSVVHLDALGWTADFTRCFGWAVIAPEKIG